MSGRDETESMTPNNPRFNLNFPPDPAETGLESGADGRIWLDRRFQGPLGEAGLTAFEAVMARSPGRCLRSLPDREVWHFRVRLPEAGPQGVYLKRHHVRTRWARLRSWLGLSPSPTAGRVEAKNVGALSAVGVAVMRLIAYGEKCHPDGFQESFILTEELEGFSELPHYLRRKFAAGCRTPAEQCELSALISELAGIVRRFHRAGYNHRDLYCCHFFVKEPAPGRREIRLIDLQRVQHRRRFRRRWIVKDLAQLAWSAPRNIIRCKHRIAFIKQYLGVKKLGPADKRLIRAVMRKKWFMEWKLGIED
jgi:heptose I phosphotransferase